MNFMAKMGANGAGGGASSMGMTSVAPGNNVGGGAASMMGMAGTVTPGGNEVHPWRVPWRALPWRGLWHEVIQFYFQGDKIMIFQRFGSCRISVQLFIRERYKI